MTELNLEETHLIRMTIFVLTFFLLPGLTRAELVTYLGNGAATGMLGTRQDGERFFDNVPASLTLSYTYDASIPGITQGGTTTFTVDSLTMRVTVPGFFAYVVDPRATAVPGTVTWSGDTISFRDVAVDPPGNPPYHTLTVAFQGSSLTPGVLPSSLADLRGITGTFTATADPAGTLHGDRAYVSGSVVSVPEPSSALVLVMGLVGLGLALSKGGGK